MVSEVPSKYGDKNYWGVETNVNYMNFAKELSLSDAKILDRSSKTSDDEMERIDELSLANVFDASDEIPTSNLCSTNTKNFH